MWAIEEVKNVLRTRLPNEYKHKDFAERMAVRLTMKAPKGVTYEVVEVK